jgi:hypothetical protein
MWLDDDLCLITWKHLRPTIIYNSMDIECICLQYQPHSHMCVQKIKALGYDGLVTLYHSCLHVYLDMLTYFD